MHNAVSVKNFCGNAGVCGMIKANAYGHGITQVALSLKNICCCFGVARLSEAAEVRSAADNDILICSDTDISLKSVTAAANGNFMLTAMSFNQLKEIENFAKQINKRINIHIKIDSGMNRLGIKEEQELVKMLNLFADSNNVSLKGIYTHFADCNDLSFTEKQFNTFMPYVNLAKKTFPKIIAHCASSSAIFLDKKYHLDMVRPGINLYGYCTEKAEAQGVKLLPAMEVYSTVMAVKKARAGETIGYNQNFKVKKDTFYAVISGGYGDGYKRALSNRGSIVIEGKRCKIAGNICMDSFMVKLSGKAAKTVKQGTRALLMSDVYNDGKISLQNCSRICNTIVYELLTSFTERASREFIT